MILAPYQSLPQITKSVGMSPLWKWIVALPKPDDEAPLMVELHTSQDLSPDNAHTIVFAASGAKMSVGDGDKVLTVPSSALTAYRSVEYDIVPGESPVRIFLDEFLDQMKREAPAANRMPTEEPGKVYEAVSDYFKKIDDDRVAAEKAAADRSEKAEAEAAQRREAEEMQDDAAEEGDNGSDS